MAHRRKRARGVPKTSTIAVYAGIFAFIVAVVAVGYHPPQETSAIANAASTTAGTTAASPGSIDQVVATSVAANLAASTNLSVAPNAAEFAASTQIQSQLSQPDNSAITKPQILQPTAENRSVSSYVVQAGDTVTSVAARYGLSVDTIKWANDLTSDALTVGSTLTILPTDGILYTVKNGDTLQSISSKYKVDQTRVVLYNDLDVSGITAGQKIILPSGTLPSDEQPGYVAPRSSFSGWVGVGSSSGNGYAYGNCTWYAYNRRTQLGMPVGGNWGNANTWALAARVTPGFTVNNSPSVGAVAQWNSYKGGAGWAGHVGIVEAVYSDGSITISEMNNFGYGGFGIVDTRNNQHIYSADANWPSNFIH